MVPYDSLCLGFPVNLVSANVNEALDLAGNLAGLEENVSTIDVVLRELEAISERVVDVGLCSEVHDSVNTFRDEKVVNQIRAADIALDELKVL